MEHLMAQMRSPSRSWSPANKRRAKISEFVKGNSIVSKRNKPYKRSCDCPSDQRTGIPYNKIEQIFMMANSVARLREIKQVLDMLEKRADNLEKKITIVFGQQKVLIRKKPVTRVKKRHQIRDFMVAQKVADGSTIHGLKELLTEPHPLLHSIWTFLFCACLALCAYHECQVISEYQKGQTISKIRILRQAKYEFPPILFCPDTWLDAEKVRMAGLSRGGIEIALAYLINYGVEPPPYVIADHKQAGNDFDSWWENTNFSSLSHFFKHVAINGEDVVGECTFCDGMHNFTKVLMYDSVCYQLPMTPIEGGSSLSDPDIFSVHMIDRSEGLLLTRSHWRVFVNPDLTLGMSDTHFLHVYPGFTNTVRIRPSKFTSLKSKHCMSSEEYSQALCMAVCFTESQKHICKPLRMYPSRSVPRNTSDFCHSYPLNYWAQENGHNESDPELITDDKLVSEPVECFNNCPPPCEKVVYESSVESHPLVINGTRDHGETKFHFLNEVVRYFGVLSYEEIEAYTFDRLVSNVGGMLGLWLGASIVSLIQLPMLIGSSVRKLWEERKWFFTKSSPQKAKPRPKQTNL